MMIHLGLVMENYIFMECMIFFVFYQCREEDKKTVNPSMLNRLKKYDY